VTGNRSCRPACRAPRCWSGPCSGRRKIRIGMGGIIAPGRQRKEADVTVLASRGRSKPRNQRNRWSLHDRGLRSCCAARRVDAICEPDPGSAERRRNDDITTDPRRSPEAMTPASGGPAWRPGTSGADHRPALWLIGLAMLTRMLRSRRFYQGAIVGIIAVAALGSLGQENGASVVDRLVAWNSRQVLRFERKAERQGRRLQRKAGRQARHLEHKAKRQARRLTRSEG
jgi:hypothetical protein